MMNNGDTPLVEAAYLYEINQRQPRSARHIQWRCVWNAAQSLREFLGRQPVVADLSGDAINQWLSYLQANGTPADTIDKYRRKLRAIAQYEVRSQAIEGGVT